MAIHDWSLTEAGVFHDFHLVWIARLKSTLNEDLLPRPFYALAEPILGEAEPDAIALSARGVPRPPQEPGTEVRGHLRSDSAESAVALAPSPVVVEEIAADPYSRKARRIVIKDSYQADRVVAVIELVSPGNKTSRARAEQFLRKSLSILDRAIHLVVIDLHPSTQIVPQGFHARISEELGHKNSPAPMDRRLSAVSYQALDTGILRSYFVPLKVGDSLPEMPVFLEPHEFVRLPLEVTYGEAFRGVPWKFRDLLAGTA
jgi:hypothetical protein